jgi:HSP20 family protein
MSRLLPFIARDLNRAFAALEEPLFQGSRSVPSAFRQLTRATAYPAMDIAETRKHYIVQAELPGARREDIEINFAEGDTLVLKGKMGRRLDLVPLAEGELENPSSEASPQSKIASTQVEPQEGRQEVVQAERNEPHWWENERVVGAFQRSVTFPGKLDTSQVAAKYQDGILSIVIPKPEGEQTVRINVE